MGYDLNAYYRHGKKRKKSDDNSSLIDYLKDDNKEVMHKASQDHVGRVVATKNYSCRDCCTA